MHSLYLKRKAYDFLIFEHYLDPKIRQKLEFKINGIKENKSKMEKCKTVLNLAPTTKMKPKTTPKLVQH